MPPPAHRLPLWGDIQQDGAERRGGAGRANQPGQGAHQEHAGQRAAALGVAPVSQPGLQCGRQLQGIEAEHRQRQRDKQHRQTDQDIRMLQRRLELQSGGGHHQAQQGVGERHALYVNHRQRQNAAAALWPVAAEDDAGDQRVHRQHARGEGDADADQQRPQRRERQAGRCGGRFSRCRGRERRGCGGADGIQRNDPGFRRVAEAGLGAALIGDAEAGVGRRLLQRHLQIKLLLEDSDFAEELVLVAQTFRQGKGAERRLLRHQFDLLAIQVVAGADLPVQRYLAALLFEIEGEGLIDRHELAAAFRREQRGLRRLRQEAQAAQQQNQFKEALIHNR